MRLSNRIRSVVEGGDDGWDLYYRARALQEAGRPVAMLTIGDHDVKTAPALIEAMAESARGGNTGYAPVPGAPALRAALAQRLSAQGGPPLRPENVFVAPGGQAGLFASLMAVLDPGDGCLLIEPCYATFPLTVRAAGGRPVAVAARAEDGFQPRPEALAAACGPDVRALLANSPNNPTGAVYSAECWEGIAALCRQRDLWLVADALYETQVYDGEGATARALPGMAERTLTVGSLSKSHAMTGWRLGWVAGPEAAIARIAELAIATTYGVPGFIQEAALAALAGGGEAEVAARYRRRRDAALAALEGAEGVRAHRAAGGMYLFLDVREADPSGSRFALGLLEAEGVAVMPGESFGAAGAGHVRVALTRPEAELADAMRRLARFAARRAAAA